VLSSLYVGSGINGVSVGGRAAALTVLSMTSFNSDATRPETDETINWRDANAELHALWVQAHQDYDSAVASGDPEAVFHASSALERLGTKFYEQNRGLAMSVARMFFLPGDDRGKDYLQAASLGLWEAFLKWDPNRGATFGTFSRAYIKGRTQRAVRIDEFSHLSQNDFARRRDVLNVKAELIKTLGREPVLDELAKAVGLSHELVDRILSGRNVSLDTTVGDDGTTLGDLVAGTPQPEDPIDNVPDVESLLDELNEIELWVLTQRYDALGGDPSRSLLEIGDDIGVGREITRRAETRARLKIAQINLSRKLGRRPSLVELSKVTEVDIRKIPLLMRGSTDDLAARWNRLRHRRNVDVDAVDRLGEEFVSTHATMIWNLANGYVYQPGSSEPLTVEDAALAVWDAFGTWDESTGHTFPAWARRHVDRTFPRRRRARDEQPDTDLLEPTALDHVCRHLWRHVADRRLPHLSRPVPVRQ
jgi:RNA polymerase sporulation-specific sigma factor